MELQNQYELGRKLYNESRAPYSSSNDGHISWILENPFNLCTRLGHGLFRNFEVYFIYGTVDTMSQEGLLFKIHISTQKKNRDLRVQVIQASMKA